MREQSARRSRWPQAILFDLDGTLIDSAPDIAAAVNELLALEKLGPLSVDDVRRMIGNGVAKLVERAFAAVGRPLFGDVLEGRIAAMMEIYARHLTGLTVLLPGALKIMEICSRAGSKLAVVSNKPDAFTREILDHYGFLPHLDVVQGAAAHLKVKPAPDMLNAALATLGEAPEDSLFVGDSAADAGAAKAAGMQVVLVRGGYTLEPLESFGADAICDTLETLPQVIERLRALA